MSDKISWRNEFIIGVPRIDAQHHSLVDLLQELQESAAEGEHTPAVGKAIKTLVEYTRTHFRDEEALMEQIGFAGLEKHAALHKQLLGEVVTILQTLKAGKDYTVMDLIKFLNHWVIDHILREDTKIGVAFRKTAHNTLYSQ
jgi:hemerythrin-like metal-binding protein